MTRLAHVPPDWRRKRAAIMAQRQDHARPRPRLYLVTPEMADPAAAVALLAPALAAGAIAAVLLRLAAADERPLIHRNQALAPGRPGRRAALLLAGPPELVAR